MKSSRFFCGLRKRRHLQICDLLDTLLACDSEVFAPERENGGAPSVSS